MGHRSEVCRYCSGSGEAPSLADEKTGSVFFDGGISSCDFCKGTGRTTFKLADRTESKKLIDYERRLTEEVKRYIR